MSKRRQPGELVVRKASSGFCGSPKPRLVRLSHPSDGPLHEEAADAWRCFICDDSECREWANVQIVGGPHGGEWMYHISECQMDDPTAEELAAWERDKPEVLR